MMRSNKTSKLNVENLRTEIKKKHQFIAKALMILETIDECESCAYACICVSICHYKLLA